DLEHPRGAPDAQFLGQAREDTHDEVDGGAFAMKDRAEGLEKVATTGDTQQLPPGTATGMAISAEIPPAHTAAICTVPVGAEMGGGADWASAPRGGEEGGGWSGGGWGGGSGGVLTGVAVRLGGEAHKRLGLTVALGHGDSSSGVVGPVAAESLGHAHWSMSHS